MIANTCRHAAALLSRSREESLGVFERVSLYVHLMVCPNCRTYSRQLHWIDQALAEAYRKTPVVLSIEARLRIAQALSQPGRGEPRDSE
ncbi:hypothetical protein [Acidihalobacter ferrooxydans]|uniref:Zinc-finger domain-containing protein n=1 Tax=Acidihalobacter ferrooxydans TaxID=1765967 RepID=A0A1P8UEJ9_9GAMM|nr:hypothetical protein [Acidihalobacter ferrooxydans]APZ42261.1 hypothetical protein BW247_03450 [Acidihalobacter ferrooxydans]